MILTMLKSRKTIIFENMLHKVLLGINITGIIVIGMLLGFEIMTFPNGKFFMDMGEGIDKYINSATELINKYHVQMQMFQIFIALISVISIFLIKRLKSPQLFLTSALCLQINLFEIATISFINLIESKLKIYLYSFISSEDSLIKMPYKFSEFLTKLLILLIVFILFQFIAGMIFNKHHKYKEELKAKE